MTNPQLGLRRSGPRHYTSSLFPAATDRSAASLWLPSDVSHVQFRTPPRSNRRARRGRLERVPDGDDGHLWRAILLLVKRSHLAEVHRPQRCFGANRQVAIGCAP